MMCRTAMGLLRLLVKVSNENDFLEFFSDFSLVMMNTWFMNIYAFFDLICAHFCNLFCFIDGNIIMFYVRSWNRYPGK